jgi:hypothetical protein
VIDGDRCVSAPGQASWPRRKVLDLVAAHWQQTLEQVETQHKLDANVFRRVTLGLPPLG